MKDEVDFLAGEGFFILGVCGQACPNNKFAIFLQHVKKHVE